MAEARRQEATAKFGNLEQKLMVALDQAGDKLETMRPEEIMVKAEVPVVWTLEAQKTTFILQ